ncbi:hypothetical protein AMS68_001182 [Peltaster fructicola]|uniref:Uncharacterized protein n=1 Tax=Peltaster fructicola TaxID=286661 RepID=A0A6H0XM08_9PEZI|nr:hypothetical protein AMS68_001182 [Peltaster fructicola]
MDTRSQYRFWAERQVRKEPTTYDEWSGNEQKEVPTATKVKTRRHGSTAGVSVAASGTMAMRNEVPPETAAAASTDQGRSFSSTQFDERNARSTPNGVPSASTSSTVMYSSPASSPIAAPRSRRKEYGRDESTDAMAAQRTPSTRTLRSSEQVKGTGMLGRRRSSRSNNGSSPAPAFSEPSSSSTSTRPRTRTLDDRRPYEQLSAASSSSSSSSRQRQRIGSINANIPTSQVRGADYLASVPAVTAATPPPTITSLAGPVQRSTSSSNNTRSAMSAMSAGSAADGVPALSSTSKRLQHLMKTLHGSMSGVIQYRRGSNAAWTDSYCFVQPESASLIYEVSVGANRTLIPNLRGCHIEFGREEDTIPYIIVRPVHSAEEVHLKVLNQTEFDSWIAVLLTWQGQGHDRLQPAVTASPAVAPPIPPPPTSYRSSAARSISPHTRKRADSDRSQHRRKSVIMSMKEAPVIKIGKMVFWDTDVTYGQAANAIAQSSLDRPTAHRMQSYGSRRWRRISALLRENGELKLHADRDNSLLSVVQLSQLSRCAIQRLDQSVLDNEFCIAIYPQYASTPSENVAVMRPIFLSLESRVLHEVWFVLLRAFTIPQLYGPRLPEEMDEDAHDSSRDFEKMLAEQTTDMFRVERSLSVRVVEAKLYGNKPISAGSHSMREPPGTRSEQYGYHVEVLLDNETRAKTAVKFEGLTPLWGETFDFTDVPPVLTSASVVIKRRPPESWNRSLYDAHKFASDMHGGYSGMNFDITIGKVEIYLDELTASNEAERWWPVVNMFGERVGDVLVKARADEGVVLMARDYQPLCDLLHNFGNGLSIQLAQIVPGELKRLSDCLLNIYQVSGRAGDWIMALVEDEIDSFHKETPITRLRYNGRGGSNDTNDQLGTGSANSDRELMVRDMNKNATLEANLLFRGNTLLTKSLDSHMRRVGKDFLEEALATKLKEICERDPECEVDPNKASDLEVKNNWRRLIALTSEVWKSIVAAKQKCPIELRRIFRHIRACAEDRYGDFLRSVSYSSVSGFLFLRFFCPAVLNPKLFGLLKEDMKPRARRTLTLIAKSLQTLANMASFGTKEQWMEPMNIFLNQSREAFKNFIDDICYVPPSTTSRTASSTTTTLPAAVASTQIVSADTHLSYTTPMTIMQRLPPTSREGFPSLPYLVDQPRALAELVQLWLETTSDASATRDMAFPGRSKSDLLAAIRQSDGDVGQFHEICVKLNARTQECLSRAERAERPHSALSFQWEELIDQLQSPTETENADEEFPMLKTFTTADRVKPDTQLAEPSVKNGQVEQLIGTLSLESPHELQASRSHDPAPTRPAPVRIPSRPIPSRGDSSNTRDDSYRSSEVYRPVQSRALQSRDSNSPASPISFDAGISAPSSDNEPVTTALPKYERDKKHRRREEVGQQGRSSREPGEKRQGIKFVSALRKKRIDRDGLSNSGNGYGQTP